MNRSLPLLVILVLVLGACVSIPTDSEIGSLPLDEEQPVSTAHYLPAGPVPDAKPADVARGFVEAMLAYPMTRKVAAEFLTPEAEDSWRGHTDTWIYSDAKIRTSERDRQVFVDVVLSGTIDSAGKFTLLDERKSFPLQMERVADQWRVAEPPPGILVSEDWADSYIQSFAVHFFSEGDRLVPMPVHAVVGDQLATALVAALSAGVDDPSAGLRSWVPGPDEIRGSVPVLGSIAEIDLEVPGSEVPESTSDRMLAQLNWTLAQVPGVEGVRVKGSDGVLVAAERPVGISSWLYLGLPSGGRYVHVVVDGKVQRLDGGSTGSAPGSWGSDAQGAEIVAIGGTRVAALRGDEVVVGSVDGARTQTVGGEGFLGPQIDVTGVAWLVDREGQRIRVVDEDGVHTVGLAGAERWSSFAVSPDGSRWAAVTRDGRLRIGWIRRVEGHVDRLEAGRVIPLGDVRIRQVAWLDGLSLVLAVKDDVRPLRKVLVDGSEIQPWPDGSALAPHDRVEQLVVAPVENGKVTILDRKGVVWLWDDGRWLRVAGDALGIS